jgi:hypothetical protein
LANEPKFEKAVLKENERARFVRSPALLGRKEQEMHPVLRIPWVLAADNKGTERSMTEP